MQVVRGAYLQYHEQLTGSPEFNPKKNNQTKTKVSQSFGTTDYIYS